jgi:hypothetical protein
MCGDHHMCNDTWRRLMREYFFPVAVVVGLCLVGAAGCGTKTRLAGLSPVEGTVTFQGSGVEGAMVVFVPATATTRAAVGTTDATGRFKLTTKDPGDGAAPGPYLITVSKTEASGGLSAAEADQWSRSRDNVGKYPPRPKITEHLPKKYKVVNTSGLQATVTDGLNTINLVLKD